MGTYGDVVVADAIVKQVPGFEVATAWEAIRKDSYSEDPGGHDGVGKAGLRHYDEHQYIPSDVGVSEMVKSGAPARLPLFFLSRWLGCGLFSFPFPFVLCGSYLFFLQP